MKNKGKGRTDLKYIAVLFVLIMMFSAIGILFGNVQIGNNSNNTKFMPASNPAGSLELTIPSPTGSATSGYYYYYIYSNGTILLAPLGSNNLNSIYYSNGAVIDIYLNLTYNGVEHTIMAIGNTTESFSTASTMGGMWVKNISYLNYYNNAFLTNGVLNMTENQINYDRLLGSGSLGMFANDYSGIYSQNFVFAMVVSEAYNQPIGVKTISADINIFYIQNEVGQTSTITATPSGGTAPYTYQWYVDGIAISGNNVNTYSYSSNTVSQANIICKITDATGAVQWSEPDYIMTNAHTTVSMSGQQYAGGTNEADVGQSILFTGAFVNNPYGISKNGIYTGTSQFASGTSTASSGSYTFGSAGSYTIEFYAVDINGYNATTTISYTIYADPILSVLSTQNSAHTYNNIKTTDVNIPIYIIGNASLGSGGYSYSWSGSYASGGGNINGNSDTLTYTPTAVSTTGYTITLVLTDSNGLTYTATVLIIVNTDMSIVITTTTTGQ